MPFPVIRQVFWLISFSTPSRFAAVAHVKILQACPVCLHQASASDLSFVFCPLPVGNHMRQKEKYSNGYCSGFPPDSLLSRLRHRITRQTYAIESSNTNFIHSFPPFSLDHYRFPLVSGTGRVAFAATTATFAAILVLVGDILLRPLPVLPRYWYWSCHVCCDHCHFCRDIGTGRAPLSVKPPHLMPFF